MRDRIRHNSSPQTGLRRRQRPGMLLLDPRPYRRHRGHFLHADRVYIAGLWTPVVYVRPRLPRAADGATEH